MAIATISFLEKWWGYGIRSDPRYADLLPPGGAAAARVVLRPLQSEPGSPMHRAVKRFLFESEWAFLIASAEAGIGAEKLRRHLQLGHQLGPDEMGRLLEEREREGQ